VRRFAVALVVGSMAVAGCSSSGKTASTTTTTPSATTTTSGSSTTKAHPTTTAAGSHPSTTAAPHTTATAAPLTSSSPAESASWVSANQGFALLRSGQVDATTDGGHHWHRVGTIGRSGDEAVIRFIGPADGFEFTRMSGSLLITHDGGATWSPTPTPFATVDDLAILRGTIYAVAFHPGSPVVFDIWSTPVAHLVWKQDPLTLPVGAGPVPLEQIALAPGTGWILGVNRTVIAGARLGANGRWAKWTPPCANYGGVAGFTASSSTDLVAVCNPGPGTPPSLAMTTTIKFSHNGGTTFASSHSIPGARFGVGGPLSPSAETAVIVDAGDLRRTTDSGATWHTVVSFPAPGGAVDLGFTTSTQGFVILSAGQILMTYDAGATWTRSTLP